MNKATKVYVVCLMTLVMVSLPSTHSKIKEDKVNNKSIADNIDKGINKKIATKEIEIPRAVVIQPTIKTITVPKYKQVDLILTFYTSLPPENGGYSNITASGKTLSRGMVAANKCLSFGTKIETEEFGTLTVEDRGSEKHFYYIDNCTYRLDVFVPKHEGETNRQYKQRVAAMGVKKIKGKILLEKGD